jgi:hypothetical protein
LKLEFGNPSSIKSPMRFIVSLRRKAAANTSTPTAGSTKGMTLRAKKIGLFLKVNLLQNV